MSRAHQVHLERLVRLGRGALDGLLRGEPPDLDAFDTERDAELTALDQLGDLDPSDPSASECRVLLRELARVTHVLLDQLSRLREDTRERLVVLDQGRRGLRGYQRALAPAARAGWRHGRG